MNPKATALVTAITQPHNLSLNDVDALVAAVDGDAAFRSVLLDQRAAAIFTQAQAQSTAATSTGTQKAEHLAGLVENAIRLALGAPMARLTALEALKDQVRSLNDRVLELEASKAATSQVEP